MASAEELRNALGDVPQYPSVEKQEAVLTRLAGDELPAEMRDRIRKVAGLSKSGRRKRELVHNMGMEVQAVATSDGGNGLRNAIEARFDDCEFFLDHPHLVSHLRAVAREQHADEPDAWVLTTLDRL